MKPLIDNAISPQTLCMTRWQAMRTGMWQGAKLGFLTFVGFVIVLVAAGMVVLLWLWIGRSPVLKAPTPLEIVKGIGSIIIFILAFGTLYGAIPGALIMGIIAGVR